MRKVTYDLNLNVVSILNLILIACFISIYLMHLMVKLIASLSEGGANSACGRLVKVIMKLCMLQD